MSKASSGLNHCFGVRIVEIEPVNNIHAALQKFNYLVCPSQLSDVFDQLIALRESLLAWWALVPSIDLLELDIPFRKEVFLLEMSDAFGLAQALKSAVIADPSLLFITSSSLILIFLNLLHR